MNSRLTIVFAVRLCLPLVISGGSCDWNQCSATEDALPILESELGTAIEELEELYDVGAHDAAVALLERIDKVCCKLGRQQEEWYSFSMYALEVFPLWGKLSQVDARAIKLANQKQKKLSHEILLATNTDDLEFLVVPLILINIELNQDRENIAFFRQLKKQSLRKANAVSHLYVPAFLRHEEYTLLRDTYDEEVEFSEARSRYLSDRLIDNFAGIEPGKFFARNALEIIALLCKIGENAKSKNITEKALAVLKDDNQGKAFFESHVREAQLGKFPTTEQTRIERLLARMRFVREG